MLERTPGGIFRAYMAAVLLQFAVLSFCSVQTIQPLDMPLDTAFWWGIFALFGAMGLLFRTTFRSWKAGTLISDISAVVTFSVLSYDFMTRKPPIFVGGVLSATAVAFLIGGLINERKSDGV